jgi:hypothetical protein
VRGRRKGSNGPNDHRRDVHVLLSVLRRAGVFAGLDSVSIQNLESQRPTRHQARWVFGFCAQGATRKRRADPAHSREQRGASAANAAKESNR